ncbi:VCBS repeat-containing protein [Aequorivita todarodis]|uniref:VCBS repeat-containing protein n=1 Tax=Aequorivita todarodis TaxID=2036821 RepID=UPI002350B2AA|nr:VCBS repeat-containing protein [Aequorivita todarodis]MDC8000169.1 VCBS repeat-containing protein [Aequorivita todarodis]
MKTLIVSLIFSMFLFSCSQPSKKENATEYTDSATTLYSKITSETSQLNFKNVIKEDVDFNFLNYTYIYVGGGVAVGDIDNDGLQDLYFVSSMGPNKLYRNKGNLVFEDITTTSKAEDYKGFSTGASMLDINNDGWLDIYVCKAGSVKDDNARRNLLFINQKDGTFKEEAKKWGLDDPGYSTQAYQLDYDKDGDLDLYVVNYRYDFKNNTTISAEIQSQIEEITSDQLYRNDGTTFTKVTGEARLYNKTWGLAAAVGDFNNDGWDDIYVSNDFLEPDQLYINQKDGSFKNEINSRIDHISFYSMGSDYADLNNDLLPDLLTVDMTAENYKRSKQNMASMDTENFYKMVAIGYNHPYMANMLHYNKGNGKFNETALLSGVAKSDWSWAPLIADFDNDGMKDIFITNGVIKDYTNQDFRTEMKKKMANKEQMTLEAVQAMLPSQKLNNYIYKNNGDLTFSKKMEEWGMEDPTFSNGAAYADLDNDGDLDLIVNNIDDEVGLYRNNANNNFLQVKLKGPSNNSLGIGAKVYVKKADTIQFQQLYLARGFQSSVTDVLHFGLGKNDKVDEVVVQWPDGKISKLNSPASNKMYNLDYSTATAGTVAYQNPISKKVSLDPASIGIDYVQKENDFDDFTLQLLIPQKQSTKGSGLAVADVNGDGLEDFFVGNAAGAEAALYIQKTDGSFSKTNEALWKNNAKYEDANALFFDADGDGDQDLYVASAGYELDEKSPLLQDRLFVNDGKGNFTYKKEALPPMLVSSKSIAAADFDGDGDIDLFVGGNVVPKKYPLPPRSYLLKNENGNFIDATEENPSLKEIGMVSEAVFTDYDNDKDLDLLVTGEWMAPTIFNNNNGKFTKNENIAGLENTEGWWFTVTAADFDGDGDEDYVFGNIGGNNKFHPSAEKPLFIYAKDFDSNGSFDVAMSKINDGRLVPVRGKECSSQQNPFLLDKIKSYKEFSNLDMNGIYGEEELKEAFKLTCHDFESMYAENLGGGKFKVKRLPNEAQLGPTLSFVSRDFNNDGNMDIMGIGAIYDAEVETIRYDSNYGYVLLGDGKGSFNFSREYVPFIASDSKNMKAIKINGKEMYMVVSNNAPLQIFNFKS